MGSDLQTLFRGASLELIRQPGGEDEVWVTFGAYTCREPACVRFIRSRNASALHIVSLDDDWYQGPETAKVLRLVKKHLPETGRRVGFGASMGGFGVLAFSARLGFDVIVAGGPQTLVDPGRTNGVDDRWRSRWESIAGRGLTRPDAVPGVSRTAAIKVLIDPLQREDVWHVRRMARFDNVETIRFPFSGHEVLEDLHRSGYFHQVVGAAIDLDDAALRRLLGEFRQGRKQRYFYWLSLGRAALKRSRWALAYDAFSAALRLDPSAGLEAHYHISFVCERMGDIMAARRHIRAALRLLRGPEDAHVYHRLAHLYACVRDFTGADAAFNEGFTTFPESAYLHHQKGVFHANIPTGDRVVAEYHMSRAVHLEPANPVFRDALAEWLTTSGARVTAAA